MNTIEITHNPFTVDTRFLINGHPPATGCKLSNYRAVRLQQWIEQLFGDLVELFNGERQFNIVFNGVEADFLDLQLEVEAARAKGAQVELSCNLAQPSEARLHQIRELMTHAETHPRFVELLDQRPDIRHAFDEAFNRDFDVYVVATMSAGKSTLINAMLGQDLLPAANEATTATITRIVDNDAIGPAFKGTRFDHAGQPAEHCAELTLATIKEWNKTDTRRIEIEGNIAAIRERESVRLVLTDTPGPNNSQDGEHKRLTMSYVQDSLRNPLVLYVLNAQQLGTTDDQALLGLVAKAMAKAGKQNRDRFIFVINKMDVFDPERGEHIGPVLERVKIYLRENGIEHPQVYPVSAELTRLIRKPNDLWTRSERNNYTGMSEVFSEVPSMNLHSYMPVTAKVQRDLERQRLSPLLLASGLPVVEAMIDEYIDKYNLPHRVTRASEALRQSIEIGLSESDLLIQLDQKEQALNDIRRDVAALEVRKQEGFDTLAYKEKIKREGIALPAHAKLEITHIEGMITSEIRSLTERLKGDVPIPQAEKTLDSVIADLEFLQAKTINAYNILFETSQADVKKALENEYQTYVDSLFQLGDSVPLPMLQSLKNAVLNTTFDMALQEDELRDRQKQVGTEEVSGATLWKPWTWFDKRKRAIYENEKFVSLEAMWQQRIPIVHSNFNKLVIEARAHIEGGKDRLVEQYAAFLDRTFDKHFDALLDQLRSRLNDQVEREQAVAEGKAMAAWIRDIKLKLEQTLAV